MEGIKKINKFIAVNLFNLKEGVDFGEWEHHDWYKEGEYFDGKKTSDDIDEWAYAMGYCNGPMCKRCGDSFCVHCVGADHYDEAINAGPCVIPVPDYKGQIVKVIKTFYEKCPDSLLRVCLVDGRFSVSIDGDDGGYRAVGGTFEDAALFVIALALGYKE